MSSHENCPCMEECPLNRVLKLIGGKWKMQILCSLHNNGPTRYNQLKRTLDGVSNTVLAGALRELEGLARYCVCGAENPPESGFCRACGRPL